MSDQRYDVNTKSVIGTFGWAVGSGSNYNSEIRDNVTGEIIRSNGRTPEEVRDNAWKIHRRRHG